MDNFDFYTEFDTNYINSFFTSWTADTFYKYSPSRFIEFIMQESVKKYFETQDDKILIFESLLKLTLYKFGTPNVFFVAIKNMLHYIRNSRICNTYVGYSFDLAELRKDYDYSKLKPIDCPKYKIIINIVLNLITAINKIYEIIIPTKYTIQSLFECVEFHDPYIYYLFATKISNNFKKNIFPLKMYNCNENIQDAKIILLQQDFLINNFFQQPFDPVYFNYGVDYLKIHNKYLLLENLLYNFIGLASSSNIKYYWDTFKENNFFDLTPYEMINNTYRDYGDFNHSLFEKFYYCYKLFNNDIELSQQINDLLDTLIDNLDLFAYHAKKIIHKFDFNILPSVLNEKIISKIIEYENLNEFSGVLQHYICYNLNITLVASYSMSINTTNENKIVDIENIIGEIYNNCFGTSKHKGIKDKRIIANIIANTNQVKSSGPGVTASYVQRIVMDFFQLVSRNGILDLDESSIQHSKRMMMYGYMCAQSFSKSIVVLIPNYIIKMMFNHEISLNDVCDEKFINSLNSLKKLSESELSDLLLTMSVTITLDGKVVNFDLEENGAQIPVTLENIDKYITLMIDYYTFKNINAPRYKLVQKFIKGYKKIYEDINENPFSNTIFKILTYLNKYPPINLEQVIKSIKCNDATTEIWLIQFLRQNNSKTIRKFINFVTGVDYLRSIDSINIIKTPLKYHLPRATTCHKEIYIGTYEDYNQFAKKLSYALNNCIGFQNP